jgi:hypothetical protein
MFKLPTTVNWKNQTYEVPDLDQLEAWVIDSVCETPEGDIVEPDHPTVGCRCWASSRSGPWH